MLFRSLPGTPSWCFGGTAATLRIGVDGLFKVWTAALKSSVANTATTFVIPNPGSATIVRANVTYYVGP